jgi:hypothetical protein
VIYTLLMYASIAFGLTVLLCALLWGVEIVLGRQIGFFLSCAAVVLVALCAAYSVYAELKLCKFVEEPPFPQCEWHAPVLLLLVFSALKIIPFLVISTVMLKQWSDSRRKRLA